MSEMTLKPNEKLDVRNILKDLDKYEPKRRGWTWRKPAPNPLPTTMCPSR